MARQKVKKPYTARDTKFGRGSGGTQVRRPEWIDLSRDDSRFVIIAYSKDGKLFFYGAS